MQAGIGIDASLGLSFAEYDTLLAGAGAAHHLEFLDVRYRIGNWQPCFQRG